MFKEFKIRHYNTCIDTGKSSAKSGGKNRSACFLVNEGFPENKFKTLAPENGI